MTEPRTPIDTVPRICTWTAGTGFRHNPSVLATLAIDLGWTFYDGEPRYLTACQPCAEYIRDYQKRDLDVDAKLLPIESVVLHAECPACWRSHGCNRIAGHDPVLGHICDGGCGPDGTGDIPDEDDRIFNCHTDEDMT